MRLAPADHAAFAALPVRMVTLGAADEPMAVHIAGRLDSERPPLVCVPGYNRNMSDFADFVPLLQGGLATDWPVVLLDLLGRGRSAYRRRAADYGTISDARDLDRLARALGIEAAIFLGQGHGGQVIMTLAAERPSLIAGAVLIDAGPATAPESLVRLRSNAEVIAGQRGTSGLTVMLRRMLSAGYPDLSHETLDRLAARTHAIDARGRAIPLFDPALIARLKDFTPDDMLVPQWQFFDLLRRVPVLLARTELTDQLSRRLFDEMIERRPDATTLVIPRQGSPALLDGEAEVREIAGFVRGIARPGERAIRRA